MSSAQSSLTDTALSDRRARLSDALDPADIAQINEIDPGSMGIAFSGGGIRSATISLGIAQALAKAGRLLDFDYCSTVSGGGYFGSFLGSLFLPDAARGPNATKEAPEDPEKAEFALKTLDAKACDTVIAWRGRDVRHPIRWLREHSRYLAPNGTSDYIVGAAYMIRNWLAMIYVYLLPVLLVSLISIAVTHELIGTIADNPANIAAAGCRAERPGEGFIQHFIWASMSVPGAQHMSKACMAPSAFPVIFSPWWIVAGAVTFVGLSAGLGYWLTETLSKGGTYSGRNPLSRAWQKFCQMDARLRLFSTLLGYAILSQAMLCLWLRPVHSSQSLVSAAGQTGVGQEIRLLGPGLFVLNLTNVSAIIGLSVYVGISLVDIKNTVLRKIVPYFLAVAVVLAWIGVLRETFLGSINYQIIDTSPAFDVIFVAGMMMAILATALTLIAHLLSRPGLTGDAYVAEIRRRLSRFSGASLSALLIVAGLAVVGSLGLSIYAWMVQANHQAPGLWHAIGVAMAPLGAWVIQKLPGWFSDGNGKMSKFLGQYLWTLALVAGVALYGLLAVSAHVGMQWLLFDGHQWAMPGVKNDPLILESWRFWFPALLLGILTIGTGASTGFINLSSLHGIYASRLTRAYIGATNIHRLEFRTTGRQKGDVAKVSIKETDPLDQIPIEVYQQCRTAAPLHLINVTLNETISDQRSQLLERDRKGVPLVFAPEGIFVDAMRPDATSDTFRSWSDLQEDHVEGLSVGQLCAISGAAASTAMGAKTTLGGALALSFANVRLGYWWDVGDLFRDNFRSLSAQWWFGWARTYFYLLNEMIARYSRDYERVNISDGGHFENSGAYELLRRRVRTIVVADNGADPNYVFEDLENLIRKARIDLCLSVIVAGQDDVANLFGKQGSAFFLNGGDEEWRQRAAIRSAEGKAAAPTDAAFCLLLKVIDHHSGSKDDEAADQLIGHILWLKPRLFEGLPVDVSGYATSHPSFPQETTANQFFDEAQWESYRAIGFGMMDRLLVGTERKRNCLRYVNRPTNWTGKVAGA